MTLSGQYIKTIEIDQSLLFNEGLVLDLYELAILDAMKKVHKYQLHDGTCDLDGRPWYFFTLKDLADLIPVIPKSKVTSDRLKNLNDIGLISYQKSPFSPVGFYFRFDNDTEKDAEIMIRK